ncbi:MAG TPA: WG repeat-containing protein [Pyrinomonadaceae bacterium]|jgi:hypothetical protein
MFSRLSTKPRIITGLLFFIIAANSFYQVSGQTKIGLFPFELDGKWGYINKTGQIIISPQFDEAGFFSDGLAKVKAENKFGFIDEKGKFVINPKYLEAQRFSEGIAAVRIDNGLWGVIDKSENMIISPHFYFRSFNLKSEIGQSLIFSEGLALVCQDKCGFIDKTGEFVIEQKFEKASPFFNGIAIVTEKQEDTVYTNNFIDKSGKYTGAAKSNLVIAESVDELVSRFREWEGTSFNFPLPAYTVSWSTNNGFVSQSISSKVGFVDAKGNFVINPKYKNAGIFSEELAPVEVNNKWGFINKKGQMLISPQFTLASWFSEGFAPVMIGDNSVPVYVGNVAPKKPEKRPKSAWGFINKNGKRVIAPQFDRVEVWFTNGLAGVHKGNFFSWINKSGKSLFQWEKQDKK